METREWLYYLLTKTGLSYYRNMGLNATSSQPKPLRYSPDTWQDINIGYERSLETWGNVRNFTLPNNFVLDGKEILSEIFHTKSVEETVYLLIQKQQLVINPTEYYFFHKYFYKGELDLSTGKDSSTKFTVNIMEGGLSKAYKAYQAVKYSLSPEDVIVKMDGVAFRGTRRFVVVDPTYIHAISSPAQEMIPMLETASEGAFFNWYFKEEVASTTNLDYSYITFYNIADDPENKANGQVTEDSQVVMHMEGTIQKNQSEGAPYGNRVGLDVRLITSTGRDILLFQLNHTFGPPGDTWFFSMDSALITILKDEKFYICTTPNANQSNNVWQWMDDVRFSYQTRDTYKTTYIKAKRAVKVFDDLTAKIIGQTNRSVSSLLTSKQNYVITCGDAVRGFPNAELKTSMDDFRKAMDVIENTGFGIIKDKAYIERKEFFLQDANVIPLGKVKVKDITKATDLMGSNINIGYAKNDSGEVNGIYSFNNTSVYTTPVKRVSNTIDRTTNYITDPYVIELYRSGLDGKKTTDDSKDSSVILLNIDYDNPETLAVDTDGLPAGTVVYNLKRVAYDSITGVVDTSTLYNIEDLTPARLMAKHMPYFDSVLTGFEGQQITFQSTDKNRDLRTELAGVVYDEDANIIIGNTTKLFKNTYFDISPETRGDIVELLEDNPNRCFSFIHENGLTYRGFNIKIGIAANTLEEQAYKLLAVANQDLTTLKNWG